MDDLILIKTLKQFAKVLTDLSFYSASFTGTDLANNNIYMLQKAHRKLIEIEAKKFGKRKKLGKDY